ncbi:MAG: S9 family peptidase [Bryobacteraceae bacterium]
MMYRLKTVRLCTLALLLSLPALAQYLPVAANLTVEGIPPIPLSLYERLEQYSEFRSASLLDWHPTRREILISTRFGDVPQVHHVAMPAGARTQLTFFSDRVTGASYQPADGSFVLFSKDTGGGEFYQLHRFDPVAGRYTLLTDGKSRNTTVTWVRDGSRVAWASTRRNGRDTDIWIMDPRDPASARLLVEVSGGGWEPVEWSPDGERLLIAETKSVNESSLFLVNPASGAKEPATPPGPPAYYGSAAFAGDGEGIYLITDRDSNFRRLAYLNLASRQLRFLRPDLRRDIARLAITKDGRRLAYVVNEDGAEVLHVLDTATEKELSLPKLPYGVIGGLRWHNNGRDLGFTFASARSPSDVYSIDVEAGTLTRWTFSETGGLNAAEFSEPELIRWKSFDGLTITGFLYLPPKRFAGPRPVIINIHGGPEGQSQPTFLGRNNYYLNELGIALIYPNVRGSTGFGKKFVNLDNGYKREDSVRDIGALLDWIAADPRLDSKRILVTGGSYGGYMTLAVMTHYNDRLCCGVDVVGISNFVTFLERTEAYRRDLRRAEYGDERDPKMREFLLSISPANNARKITKPLFVVQGKNDPRVPASESQQMVAAIRANGGTVWFLMADDEGHGFAKKKNQDFQFAATVLFVERYLLK